MNWRDPIPFALFLITLIVYWVSSTGDGAHYNYHVLLADAFANGRLDFKENYSWMEIVVWEGRFYTVFPPGPALMLTPIVWLLGPNIYQPYMSFLFGALNVWLCYFVILQLLGGDKKIATLTSILYAFGTIQWFHAEVGSGWYLSHIVALFYMWLAILVALRTRNYFFVGLCLGGAYLARLPTILSVIFIAVFFIEDFLRLRGRKLEVGWKNGFMLAAGILPALAANFGYNYFRWGVFYDRGYDLLPIHNEPWYVYGLFSYKYIPIHLKEMLLSIPTVTSNSPYVTPSMFAMAIWMVTPALFLMFAAPVRRRVYLAAWVAVLSLALPGLAHGGNGFTQFGYRHTLDYQPFLLILMAGGMTRAPSWISRGLILLSILANAWGVIMITHIKHFDMSMRTFLDLLP